MTYNKNVVKTLKKEGSYGMIAVVEGGCFDRFCHLLCSRRPAPAGTGWCGKNNK